jgi:hypothetical protein
MMQATPIIRKVVLHPKSHLYCDYAISNLGRFVFRDTW